MMKYTPEEIGAKMNALGIWDLLLPYNFGIRPKGTAFPYFISFDKGGGNPVAVRLLILDGWQTLHDYIRAHLDHNFGYYTSPLEMPHLELVVLTTGECRLLRHDPCFMPISANEVQRRLATRILWEAYGVMLRVESDRGLPMRFSADRAIFARVEGADGKWTDCPLEIPNPPPYSESITIPKEDLKKAKDLPFVREDVLDVDFRLQPCLVTNEPRPRCVYELLALDGKTGQAILVIRASPHLDTGLKAIWEAMPKVLLQNLIKRGKLPGEIRTRSGRVFRFLRPLCEDIPFKLSLHDKLPTLTSYDAKQKI